MKWQLKDETLSETEVGGKTLETMFEKKLNKNRFKS